jgi:hypothetical protein
VNQGYTPSLHDIFAKLPSDTDDLGGPDGGDDRSAAGRSGLGHKGNRLTSGRPSVEDELPPERGWLEKFSDLNKLQRKGAAFERAERERRRFALEASGGAASVCTARRLADDAAPTDDEHGTAASSYLIPPRSLETCGVNTIRRDFTVYHAAGRASLGGVARCKSPWSCPVCAPPRRRAYADKLLIGMKKHSKAGGTFLFLSLAPRHTRETVAVEQLEKFRRARDIFCQSKLGGPLSPRSIFRNKISGFCDSWDYTWGRENGHHFHKHMILFVRPGEHIDAATLRGAWTEAWLRSLRAAGLDNSIGEYALNIKDVRGGTEVESSRYVLGSIARYLADVSTDDARNDCQRTGRYTAFDLLAAANPDLSVECEYRDAWREYVSASRGGVGAGRNIRYCRFSRGFDTIHSEIPESSADEDEAGDVSSAGAGDLGNDRADLDHGDACSEQWDGYCPENIEIVEVDGEYYYVSETDLLEIPRNQTAVPGALYGDVWGYDDHAQSLIAFHASSAAGGSQAVEAWCRDAYASIITRDTLSSLAVLIRDDASSSRAARGPRGGIRLFHRFEDRTFWDALEG